jgi:hypothetical protein
MATRILRRSSPWPVLTVASVRERDWWKWTLIALGAIYLAIVARYFTTIITNTETSADATSAQMIGELLAHRSSGSPVYLGDVAYYSTLIFELATKWLPAHRQIWDAGPYGFALISIALMSWTAAQVAGRRAAYLTAILLLCASPALLGQMFWLNNHMTSTYALALLAAMLILLQTRAETLGRGRLTVAVVGSALIVGVNMGSDQLLIMVAPVALLLASVTTWRARPSAVTAKAARWSAVALVVMCATAAATVLIMRSQHIYPAPFELVFASREVIVTNFSDWWQSLAVLGNGSFFGKTLTLATGLSALCGGLVVVAVVLMPRLAWRYVQARLKRTSQTTAAASAYLVFWAACMVLLSLAFIFSSAPYGLETTRYLTAVIYAAAAVVPLYARTGALARLAVLAGTAVFALTSIQALLRSGLLSSPSSGPTPQIAAEVQEVAERYNATQGFAVYWDAAPITWFSHMKVRAYPFFGCPGDTMCPPSVNWIESWYRLPPNERTFLISDTKLPYAPPAKFGRPLGVYYFGAVTMYVFGYDIGRYMT